MIPTLDKVGKKDDAYPMKLFVKDSANSLEPPSFYSEKAHKFVWAGSKLKKSIASFLAILEFLPLSHF